MKFREETIAFSVGMSIMVLELVGSRLLAPFLGTSIYIWTSLIGIILAALALGYFLGGKLADQGANYKTLGIITISASISVFLVAQLHYYILDFISQNIYGLRTGSVLAGLILFAGPSTLMAMVSPYVVRLKMASVESSGQTVGTLYAISTIGSIFGTFLAGFVLVSYFTNSQILLLLSGVLLFTSILSLWPIVKKVYVFLLLAVALSVYLFGPKGDTFASRYLAWVDSPYQTLKVFDRVGGRENLRFLRTDPFGVQGAISLEKEGLVFDYLRFFDIYQVFSSETTKALMIGAGVYAYPRHFVAANEEASIDVVDIDPQITEVSQKYFGLKEHPRISIFHEDGRVFVNRTRTTYDVVFLDAFNSLAVPYQLTTKEFLEKVRFNLASDGLIVTNLISSLEGRYSKFLHSSIETYQQVFPIVKVFAVVNPNNKTDIQNIILVGSKTSLNQSLLTSNPQASQILASEVSVDVDKEIAILSDDYAPVDNYILSLFENKRTNDF